MDFQFVHFNPKAVNRFDPHAIEVSNQCFDFWRTFWSDMYRKAGSEAAFKQDDFYRQDLIGAILKDGKVVSIWMHSFFNVRCLTSLNHSYFKFYDEAFLKWLKTHDIEDVMSLEFFTAGVEVQGQAFGVSIGRVMAWIAQEFLKHSHAQALIASARSDVGATHLAYEIGYECVVPKTIQRNFPCDLIACRKDNIVPTSHLPSLQLAKNLWRTKVDLTNREQKIEYKKTA